jgi:hypothetical protein
MGIHFTEEESKVEERKARGPLKDIRTHAPTKEFKPTSIFGVKTNVFVSDPKILKDGLFSGSYVTF